MLRVVKELTQIILSIVIGQSARFIRLGLVLSYTIGLFVRKIRPTEFCSYPTMSSYEEYQEYQEKKFFNREFALSSYNLNSYWRRKLNVRLLVKKGLGKGIQNSVNL